MEAWLSEKYGFGVSIFVPQGSRKSGLLVSELWTNTAFVVAIECHPTCRQLGAVVISMNM